MYLDYFTFPSGDMEFDFLLDIKRTCYNSYYPFKILSKNKLGFVEFEPITIFYGGNGSGKSTALNIIAEKLKLKRDSIFNKTNFYEDYLNLCTYRTREIIPKDSRIITSDDVFDYMLNIRNINEGIDLKREEVFSEFLEKKYSQFKFETIEDYEELKQINTARRKTQSKYIKDNLADNIKEYSNGESAFKYFTEKIKENSLYLLDEPENSLSPKMQKELAKFIIDSQKYFNCQFIISTHSVFLLAIENSKIYNLDKNPVKVDKWTELDNVLEYYEFFKNNKDKFI